MAAQKKISDATNGRNELPAWALAGLVLAAWTILLGAMLASMPAFAGGMMVILTDGIMAALVLVAAGGYGYAVFRFLAPAGSPRLLSLATSAALGLWLLSTAVLVVGSTLSGALSMFVWWPVLGAGVAAALAQAHRPLGKVRLPAQVSGAALVWVLAAAAAGIWLAGAVMPPGWMGSLTMDSYDILEYHLQLPREYYQAGRVQTLSHNVYSHYPLGVEMLFLLGICLRGGAHKGMYLAKLMSGLFGVVAVAGVFGGLSGTSHKPGVAQEFRRRATTALLATAPWVIYFSWLAMVELAQICYLALALVWLRRWLEAPSARSAGWIGAMLGAACAVKYLSVAFVAAPVLAVMLTATLRRPRRWRQAALAGAMTVALFCPWLIRNTAATGNPVFPLATGLFGQGHFSDECAKRWRDGHAPGYHPPVPTPPDYRAPEGGLSRTQRLSAFLLSWPVLGHPALGAGVLLVLVGTILAMCTRPRGVGSWDWALLGALAMQMLLWALLTRDMPARFISVAVVPISMLAAGGLARLAEVREVRWLRQSAGLGGRWGLAPAALLLLATGAMNVASAAKYYGQEMSEHRRRGWSAGRPAGWPAEQFAQLRGFQGRLMMVGEAAMFYYPPATRYATIFDTHPLQALMARGDPAGRLAGMGVTHVGVRWDEIGRLRATYGWPSELSPKRLRLAFAGWKVVHEVWDAMTPDGPAPGARKIVTFYAVPGAAAPATAEAPPSR